jgi:hypothetical protein
MLILLALSLFLIPLISAVPCELDISMINQDPYPAIPGDYVKVVFQIDGIENPECGTVTFAVKEDYPISLDPTVENPITINSGTFQRTYSSFYLATYKLRVHGDAINGDNPIEVSYKVGSTDYLEEFNLYVQDTRADFEVNVKSYDYVTKELTLEILNIEKVDVEALTIEIPKQDGIQVKGANRKVIGDLDSNEYTSADFEATLPTGETSLMVKVIYTDSINIRREITKEVIFDSSYFEGRNSDQKKTPWFWIIVIIAVIAWFIYRRVKKKKREAERKKKFMK